MENISVLTKILDYISKPTNFIITIAAFLASLTVYLLNFLSRDTLEILKISSFLDNFSFIIFLIVVVTFFILLIQLLYILSKKIKESLNNKRYKKHQMEIFEDEHCFKILQELYKQHPNGVDYPLDNQCIQLLSQYGLILKPSSSGYMTRTGKQIYSYILQPETVKMLKRKLD